MNIQSSWDKDYELGIPSIDYEHQGLVAILDVIPHLPENEAGLELFFKYLGIHFNNEEYFLKSINFPDLNHYHIHKNEVRILTDLSQKEGVYGVSSRLLKHILGHDMEIAEYVEEEGIEIKPYKFITHENKPLTSFVPIFSMFNSMIYMNEERLNEYKTLLNVLGDYTQLIMPILMEYNHSSKD